MRATGAFQQTVSSSDVVEMARHLLGGRSEVRAAVELKGGVYNNTYHLHMDDGESFLLRVSPPRGLQLRIEPELLRNEYFSAPFLGPIAHLMPKIVGADFTSSVIDRDYLIQTYLHGVPAHEILSKTPRFQWPSFFRQLGTIAAAVHEVEGVAFGRVAGPTFSKWSEALISWFTDAISDMIDFSLKTDDAECILQIVRSRSSVLDQITVPCILQGDLWVQNLMTKVLPEELMITGVFDCDRIWWGDPAADWAVYMASRRSRPEIDSFWDGYGSLPSDRDSVWRSYVYEARHTLTLRLEYARLGMRDDVPGTYDEMRIILNKIGHVI